MTWLMAWLALFLMAWSTPLVVTARPTPAAKPVVVATHHAPAPAPSRTVARPAILHLWLSGNYTDCSGRTPLRMGLWRDTCMAGIYLVSHNVSTGASFFSLRLGSQVSFQGRLWSVYRIHSVYSASWRPDGAPLTLQTCENNAGTVWLMVDLR